MAHYLMMAQRGIEDLYDFGHTLQDEHVRVRVEEIYNNIRNMMQQRRREVEQRNVLPVIPQQSNRPRLYTHEGNSTTIKKILSKTALNTPCDEQCVICFDTHNKIDSLTTDCNHEFGRACYNNWILTHNSCPICRQTCKSVTIYKGRSTRQEGIEIDA